MGFKYCISNYRNSGKPAGYLLKRAKYLGQLLVCVVSPADRYRSIWSIAYGRYLLERSFASEIASDLSSKMCGLQPNTMNGYAASAANLIWGLNMLGLARE